MLTGRTCFSGAFDVCDQTVHFSYSLSFSYTHPPPVMMSSVFFPLSCTFLILRTLPTLPILQKTISYFNTFEISLNKKMWRLHRKPGVSALTDRCTQTCCLIDKLDSHQTICWVVLGYMISRKVHD